MATSTSAVVGTRSLLRAGEWLPRRCEIVITIGMPIVSSEHDWDAALALRDAARRALARIEKVIAAEPDHGRALGCGASLLATLG